VPDINANLGRDPDSRPSSSWLSLERLAPYILGLLIVYATIRSIFAAATRAFWFDEICTWIVVHQLRVADIWSALERAADGQPPMFYLIERFAASLVKNDEIALRLPSILAFAWVVLCLFMIIRKRRGNTIALVCASIPLLTILFSTYAVEARPYSLVLACLSTAVLCYQHAPRARWMILMGLSMAFAEALHYYAIFGLVPFMLAEAILFLRTRQFRLIVWSAFACSFLPVVICWPLLARFRAYYGAHYWGLPSLFGAEAIYGWFFNTTFVWGAVIAGATALGVFATMFVAERRAARGGPSTGALFYDELLVLGFLGIPFVGMLATKLVHGGSTPRYFMAALLGFPLAAGCSLPRFQRRATAVFANGLIFLVVFLAFLVQEQSFWSTYTNRLVSPADSVEALLGSAGHSDLPVVVSRAHDFLQLAHYASPEWGRRFVSVVDPQQALVYIGTDSDDKELPALRPLTSVPLQVYDFHVFADEHQAFLLYSSNGGFGDDWWISKLFRDGYRIRAVAVQDYLHRVYLVVRTKNSS
jgi:hypothetical protein